MSIITDRISFGTYIVHNGTNRGSYHGGKGVEKLSRYSSNKNCGEREDVRRIGSDQFGQKSYKECKWTMRDYIKPLHRSGLRVPLNIKDHNLHPPLS